MKWTKGEPSRRRTQTPVRIQFKQGDGGPRQTDSFVWFPRENAWASTSDGEGYCLYPEDGFQILAWHN
jgi:hypothetical protein